MHLSQKCRYALRAVFELARRRGSGPTKVAEIAEVQAIPARFLEVILGQLRQAGFVASRRGAEGGYLLAKAAGRLTVGDVVRFVEGPVEVVECRSDGSDCCPLKADCVFLPMWDEVRRAVSEVYDRTTFEDLVERDTARKGGAAVNFAI